MKIPIFDLYRQYLFLKPKIDKTIARVIKESAYISGKDNQRFDQTFAQYCGCKYASGVASGSTALDIALEALGVKAGDEVICPSHTFAATAEAVVHRGAKPVFVDIDEPTYNLNPKLIEEKITKKTKAIIPVHLYGQTCQMKPILKLAKKYRLKVLEDAAQAHGAKYLDQTAGSMGDAAIFSFFPAKNLGCYGDGGAITTQSSQVARKINLLKDHGRISKYEHQEIGYGERLDNLQAAILNVKLPYLDKWNRRRRKIAQFYNQELKNKFITPVVHSDCESVFYVYTLRHRHRDKVQTYLTKKGIATGVYYPKPLHLQPSFAYLKYQTGSLPVSEKIAREIFSIPIFPELTDSEIEYIATTLLKI